MQTDNDMTLEEGREMFIEEYERAEDIDPRFKKKMIDQIWAITTGDHPYYVWLRVLHMRGTVNFKLCLKHWFRIGAHIRWGKEWEESHS